MFLLKLMLIEMTCINKVSPRITQMSNHHKQYWFSRVYYAILNAIISHLEFRFSKELANLIENCITLNAEESMLFFDYY